MAAVAMAAAAAVSWVAGAVASAGALLTSSLSVAGLSTFTASAITSFAFKATGMIALSAISTALMQPRIGAGGSPIAFKADPSAPISGVMGRFGVAGRQVHANTWGKDNLYISFAVALSLGPIQSVEAFTANTIAVTFPGAQGLAASVEPYKDKMWQTYRLGLPTDAYLSPPTGVSDATPGMTEWTSSHTLPGFAQTFWTMRNNSKRASYEGGVPAPLWTLHGMKLWDPRLDSTYPGGSGSSRRDDWTTWTYTEDPYLHALAFVRGHHKLVSGGTIDRTKRLAGIGAPDAAIDIAAFVEGANVCTANGWEISGEWTSVDDKWNVLAAMLQAGGGVPLNRGAQISCMVEAPRTSLLTLTGEDIVGSVNLSVMASRRDRPNTIIPRARLEAQRFEEVALGAVTSATYLTEDGEEKRTREISYPYVGLAKQAAELAAYGLANARETLKATIPCKPHLLGLRAGDAFTVTEPELGLNGQKFVVLRRAFDPGSAIVTLEVRSETEAKHAWALGQVADAPASPSLTAADPIPTTPDTADWTVAARPVEASGVQQPGLTVTGSAVGDNVGAVLIEVGPSSSGPWEQVYFGPPTTESVAINGLIGGDAYYVAITYLSLKGTPSVALVKGPYTAPDLTAGDVTPIVPGDVAGTPTLSIATTIAPDGTQVSRLSGTWAAPADALTYIVQIDNGTTTGLVPVPSAAISDHIAATGATYKYRVKALSRTGNESSNWSAWSASVAAGGDTTAPGAVTSPTVTGMARRISVRWTNPTDADFSHLQGYRNTTGTAPSGGTTPTYPRVEGSVFLDTDVVTGTTYHYWMRSLDRTGNTGTWTSLGSAVPGYISVGNGDVDPADPDLINPADLAALDGAAATKLSGIAAGAQVNPADLAALDSAASTKLAGIAAGAQVNPADLAALDATASSKLAGIAAGATVGAVWGSNISGRPANVAALSGSEALDNGVLEAALTGGTVVPATFSGKGDLATLNAVGTGEITANAVSKQERDYQTGLQTYSGSGYDTCLTQAITTAGGKVDIELSVLFSAVAGSGVALNGWLEVNRGGTTIWGPQTVCASHTNAAGTQAILAMVTFSLPDTPAAGTHTYNVTFQITGASGTKTVVTRSLAVREMKTET